MERPEWLDAADELAEATRAAVAQKVLRSDEDLRIAQALYGQAATLVSATELVVHVQRAAMEQGWTDPTERVRRALREHAIEAAHKAAEAANSDG